MSAPHRLAEAANRHTLKPCTGTLGSRPSWMGVDQYDPCRCRLVAHGQDTPHWCEHLDVPVPDGAALFGSSAEGGDTA